MKTVVDISYVSELVMVNIGIWNKKINDLSKMLITVDTGASVTTISTDILYKLGYEVSAGEKQRIITASNIEYVNSVCIDKIKIGDITINNVDVYSYSFPESSFSLGVLGLNILKKFDVYFRFSKNELEPINTILEF